MLRTELSTDHMCLPSYLPFNLSTYPCASTWNTIAHLHNVRQGPHTSYIRTCTHTSIFLPTYLPRSLSLSLSPYRTLPTLPYVAAFLPTHLLACLPSYLPADLLPSYLPAWAQLRARHNHVHICLLANDLPTKLYV